ncbi:MAG: uroporphyrinogen decarboxylase family protein [Candidatus Bathyarchaeota archaeon]|nr:uroporphyrinogen decarboxylase family protein [Candidatus Bathyarchaeota archaeon]
MNSKSRMLTAISKGMERDFPVVIPYLDIFLRDHWEEVTDKPWWIMNYIDLSARLEVEKDLLRRLDLDWVQCGLCPSRDWRESHKIEVSDSRVFLVNTLSKERREIKRPPIGGEIIRIERDPLIKSISDAEKYLRVIDAKDMVKNGSLDYAKMVVESFGSKKFICSSVSSPYWMALSSCFGFKGMMLFLFRRTELVQYMLEEITKQIVEILKAYAEAGINGVWLEECLASSNEISPKIFKEIVLPYNVEIISAMRRLALKSIYYSCGDIRDRLELILDAHPDCISLEESKKGFKIDIKWVSDIVAGQACIFGNLDSINILQNGTSDELEKEIIKQINVGRNHKKFVMSLGSPITPKTPVSRVKEYVEISRRVSQ